MAETHKMATIIPIVFFKKYFICFYILSFSFLCIGVQHSLSVGVDTYQPVISDIQVSPNAAPVTTEYLITIRIQRKNGNMYRIAKLYQMREKIEIINIPINDNGVNGDLIEGDGIYTGQAVVPKTAAKGDHVFQVFVQDESGNKSNILKYLFTVFEVI